MMNNQKNSTSGNFRYLIIKPENGGFLDLAKFLLKKDVKNGTKFLEASTEGVLEEELMGNADHIDGDDNDDDDPPYHRWVLFVSILVRKIIALFRKPMELTGYLVEFILNLLSQNGGLLRLLYSFLRGNTVMPKRGSETFFSAIGHLDGRLDLYKSLTLSEPVDRLGSKDIILQAGTRNRTLMDLCVMASKLAYENAKVVEYVVNHHWKMHFEKFYNCWDDFQKENSTQVFILCDKPKDAQLILISFRGTEPFDADDWSTDFDYSWYQIPGLGKVHVGFLEALGLGSRRDATSFQEHLQSKNKEKINSNGNEVATGDKNDHYIMRKKTAYYAVRNKLERLLQEHKNAKFLVTGHSLGGALAILFPTVLVLHNEEELLKRLLAVYTFGQPRIGNRKLGRVMESKLNHPVPKYFRMVYCNDLVPRLPYDDRTFLYKHFGECLYYNSFYVEQNPGLMDIFQSIGEEKSVQQEVHEEPNRNYFGIKFMIPEYLNAIWELFRSFLIGYVCGSEYRESWESTLLRVIGLAIPGLAAHSPVDYVNSVRLGRKRIMQRPPFQKLE